MTTVLFDFVLSLGHCLSPMLTELLDFCGSLPREPGAVVYCTLHIFPLAAS